MYILYCKRCIDMLLKSCINSQFKSVVVLLVVSNKTQSIQEAAAYAEENGLLFMETSAKTAMHVNDIFLAIGEYSCFTMIFSSSIKIKFPFTQRILLH